MTSPAMVSSGGRSVASSPPPSRSLPRQSSSKTAPGLAAQASMDIIPTPRAEARAEGRETSGRRSRPPRLSTTRHGALLGLLKGGVLLNRSYEIVDRVKGIVPAIPNRRFSITCAAARIPY